MKTILIILFLTTVFGLQGVTQLTDANFKEYVYSEPKLWLVMFSASWCGHCNNLKPHIEQLSPQLQQLGVSVGHVDEKNHKLVNDFVVDHKTHMVSYPKLLVFLGDQQMESVPPGLRSAPQILNWFKQTFSLENNEL